jgi:hypothetical protein
MSLSNSSNPYTIVASLSFVEGGLGTSVMMRRGYLYRYKDYKGQVMCHVRHWSFPSTDRQRRLCALQAAVVRG